MSMKETFAIPAVSAIIEKIENDEVYILIQRRQKEDDKHTNGMLEIVGGKVREYENMFEALRREVIEETGLTVTKIYGEEECTDNPSSNAPTINFNPFCITQNLDGIYSIVMMTFICNAEGEPVSETNETTDIHWVKLSEIEEIVENTPEVLFQMHVLPLKKYIKLRKSNGFNK